MKVSELISALAEVQATHGDIPCELFKDVDNDEFFVGVERVVVGFLGKSCWIDG